MEVLAKSEAGQWLLSSDGLSHHEKDLEETEARTVKGMKILSLGGE